MHAAWSIGTLAGGLVASRAAAADVSLTLQLGLTAIVLAGVCLTAAPRLLPGGSAPQLLIQSPALPGEVVEPAVGRDRPTRGGRGAAPAAAPAVRHGGRRRPHRDPADRVGRAADGSAPRRRARRGRAGVRRLHRGDGRRAPGWRRGRRPDRQRAHPADGGGDGAGRLRHRRGRARARPDPGRVLHRGARCLVAVPDGGPPGRGAAGRLVVAGWPVFAAGSRAGILVGSPVMGVLSAATSRSTALLVVAGGAAAVSAVVRLPDPPASIQAPATPEPTAGAGADAAARAPGCRPATMHPTHSPNLCPSTRPWPRSGHKLRARTSGSTKPSAPPSLCPQHASARAQGTSCRYTLERHDAPPCPCEPVSLNTPRHAQGTSCGQERPAARRTQAHSPACVPQHGRWPRSGRTLNTRLGPCSVTQAADRHVRAARRPPSPSQPVSLNTALAALRDTSCRYTLERHDAPPHAPPSCVPQHGSRRANAHKLRDRRCG